MSVVKFYIHLERLPAYYLLNIIIPSIVLAFLSAFAFYVPVDSGEKLSLSITILLSFSVFLLILSENTPNISQEIWVRNMTNGFIKHLIIELNKMGTGFYPLAFQAEGALSLPASVRLIICLSVNFTLSARQIVTDLNWNHQICTKHASWDTLDWYWTWRSLTLTFKVIRPSFWLAILGWICWSAHYTCYVMMSIKKSST